MNHLLLIAAGGALGAAGRHLVGLASLRFFGPGWPWGTLIANVSGGLATGLLIAWLVAEQRAYATEIRYALGVGLLGGFTTFSAFSLETVMMIERKAALAAACYVGVSVVGAVGAVMVGLFLGRSAFG